MASWTNIPNANLAAGAPIRSVDTLALRDNGAYAKQNIEVEILNTQTFTASGTWTKPTGTEYNATDTVIAMFIGAGGSGGAIPFASAATCSANGGHGGAIALVVFSYGTIGASLAVTIGAGGAAKASGNTTALGVAGNNGGDTIFNSYVLKGGLGGRSFGDGGGADSVGVANMLTTTSYNTANDGGYTAQYIGAIGRTSATDTRVYPRANAIGGGGGGSIASDVNSVLRTQNATGGVSLLGLAGAGGNGVGNGNGTAGTAPAGGGGGALSQNSTCTSGAGARGELRVYVVRGKVPPTAFIGVL